MDKSESTALVDISMRQSANSIKTTQIATNKLLRFAAKAARADILGRRRTTTRAYHAQMKAFTAAHKQVGVDCKMAIRQSNKDIRREFENRYEGQASAGVLGMSIAQADLWRSL
jgi:hypothetical protein